MAELEQYFSLDEDEINEMINAADTNQDGKLSYTEFLTAVYDRQKLLSE
jgi:Ca2+-binding EF-hand superfamily protein